MWIGCLRADGLITYPYLHNLSVCYLITYPRAYQAERTTGSAENSGRESVENCGECAGDRPELQVRWDPWKCTSGEKPPQTAVID